MKRQYLVGVRFAALAAAALATACLVPPPRPPAPPPVEDPAPVMPATFRLQAYAKDGDQPIATARLYMDNARERAANAGPDGGAAWDGLTAANFNVCAVATDYDEVCLPVSRPVDQDVSIALTKRLPPPRPTVPVWSVTRARSALPALPVPQPSGAGLWSSGPYDHDLPFDPPDQPDIDFHRGNFSGIRVPECRLQQLEGGVAGHPEHVMTWDQPQYTPEEQACILRAYAGERNYTHFLMSIPQARNHGVLDQRLIDAAVLAKQYGQFVVMVVYGGDGESWSDVLPWLDKLVALHAVDELSVCWQCDFRYDPWELVDRTKQLGEWAHAHGLKVSQHWVNEALAWWNAEDDGRRPNTCVDGQPKICNRFDYHRVMAAYVDYQYHQGDTNAPINDATNGGYQGSIGDVLRSLTTEKLVISEYDAQREFDDPAHATEDEGDAKGFLLLCARWNGRVVSGGFMNGARLLSGQVVH